MSSSDSEFSVSPHLSHFASNKLHKLPHVFFFPDAFGVILSRAELFLLMKTLEWDETEGVRNLLAHWDKMPKAQRGFYVAQAMRIVGAVLFW